MANLTLPKMKNESGRFRIPNIMEVSLRSLQELVSCLNTYISIFLSFIPY